jgi:hypothetical protein
LPGEDVVDFNVRKGFWALVAKDSETAARYEGLVEKKFRSGPSGVGYHAPNGGMDELHPARIQSTPERDARMVANLHDRATSLPGIQLVAYPLSCPEVPNSFVVMAAVNKSNKIEEYNYTTGDADLAIFGVSKPSS